jgi:hypothetical protein
MRPIVVLMSAWCASSLVSREPAGDTAGRWSRGSFATFSAACVVAILTIEKTGAGTPATAGEL